MLVQVSLGALPSVLMSHAAQCFDHAGLEPHIELVSVSALLIPAVDCGPTPTVAKPFPVGNDAGENGRQGAFVFPPPSPVSAGPNSEGNGVGTVNGNGGTGDDEEDEERSILRLSTLEFMVSLSEAKPGMVRKVEGWVGVVVKACLEGMGEFDEAESSNEGLEAWLREDVRAFPSAWLLSCD